jgi:hypothetical protein
VADRQAVDLAHGAEAALAELLAMHGRALWEDDVTTLRKALNVVRKLADK